MAIIRAVKSGNWSDPTVWAPSVPTAADDVYSNTFTVTIDVSLTVLSLQNGATTGVTAGGGFTVSANGITITCTGGNGIVGGIINTTCLTSTVPFGSTLIINSNVTGGTGNASNAILHNGTGMVNIIGNCTGGSPPIGQGAAYAVNNNSSGTVTITGSVFGGSGVGGVAYGAANSGTGTLNIVGSCTGGSDNNSSSHGAANTGVGTLNITGDLIGSSTLGGGAGRAAGAINNSTGTLNHVGAVYASATAPGIASGSTPLQITILTGPLISSDGSAGTAAASGVNPCIALRWFPADTALGTFEYRMRGATVSGSPLTRPARRLFLTNAYDSGYPATGNVRSQTTYGPGGIYAGTLAVPPAGSVALGVPVDNTTGTAFLTEANILSAISSQTIVNLNQQLSELNTPSGSLGERLKLVSTVATTAQQLSDALSNE